jgi:hypothetical protein
MSILHIFLKRKVQLVQVLMIQNDDRTTEKNKNRIAVDSSESSLPSKKKYSL